ncbi:hypothetical protein GQ600_8711 [Phytophthora cactorum]|nr:hypothetical protein GQ600_8711 [Phytophthora cactorum]
MVELLKSEVLGRGRIDAFNAGEKIETYLLNTSNTYNASCSLRALVRNEKSRLHQALPEQPQSCCE